MKIRSFLSSAVATAAIAVSALTATFVPTPAQAQFYCDNCSTVWTQMVQYAQEAETALNTAQQLETQINQYNQMVKQGLALPSQVIGNVQGDLSQLNNLVSQGSNISYSTGNLASKFQQLFPNVNQFTQNGATPASIQQQLQGWTQQTYDAASTSLQGAQQQSQQISGDESSQLTSVQNDSSNAIGQMQAIQAGNEVAAMQVQQLQKLRQLVLMQINMQAQAMSSQARQQAAYDAVTQNTQVAPSQIQAPPSVTYSSAPTLGGQ